MLFAEVIGHSEIKSRLINSVKESRISHAQLFTGPEGSGNMALALAYAQYIFCKQPNDIDACGVCPSCQKVKKLVHPDLHFAYPVALSKDVRVSTDVIAQWRESVIANPYQNVNDWFGFLDAENKQPIIATEESQEIIRKLNLTTYEGGYKIMIIWMPEKMNAAASNKLLKILEEPPDNTLFLLVCENDDQLIITIKSRTQLVKVHKLKDEEIIAKLISQDVDPEKAAQIAFLSDGNYNAALKFLDEEEVHGNDYLLAFQALMRSTLKFNTEKVFSWVDDIAKRGREEQKNFLSYSLHLVRECLMYNYQVEPLVKLTQTEKEFVSKFAPYINNKNCTLFIEEFNKASYQIERNANAKILFADLCFKTNEFLNVK